MSIEMKTVRSDRPIHLALVAAIAMFAVAMPILHVTLPSPTLLLTLHLASVGSLLAAAVALLVAGAASAARSDAAAVQAEPELAIDEDAILPLSRAA